MNRRNFIQAGLGGAWAATSAKVLSAISKAASQQNPAPGLDDPDYIIVGSGPGGGPLAANLARRGFSVLLIEAGLDNMSDQLDYKVPLLSAASAPEDPTQAWEFFVKHYSDPTRQAKDGKMQYAEDGTPLGIFYPRAATVGGCASHNFLIAVKPHESDWNNIASLTGDPSWAAHNMMQYWQRVEKNGYDSFMVKGPGHGDNGWLGTQVFDPRYLLDHDPLILRNLVAAAMQFPIPSQFSLLDTLKGNYDVLLNTSEYKTGVLTRDLNSGDAGRDNRQGVFSVPLSTSKNHRNSPRELIVETIAEGYPLTLRTGALATKVVFDPVDPGATDKRPKAIGIQYLDGTHLYKADPNSTPLDSSVVLKTVRAKREVILSGGTFNTPQLLKLSGIGPAAELQSFGLDVLVDLPGVGANLQDRYEVGVVGVADKNYSLFDGCTFGYTAADPCLAAWNNNEEGIYNTAGVVGTTVLRSSTAEGDPDLFLYGAPYNFTGYYRGYTQNIAPDLKHFSWGILKAHTRNRAGTVKLKSANPLDTPEIEFHYFDEGTTENGADDKDLEALVDGVNFVRKVLAKTDELMRPGGFSEIFPGSSVQTREEIKDFIRNEAWGHHASGTAKIGTDDDPMAVLDSSFRVRGTRGLRVVDASVFPNIPGYFIVVPIYMISEKAADVIAG